jgi:hypothetical protein
MKRIAACIVIGLAAATLPAQEGGLDVRGSVFDSTLLLHDAEAGELAYAGYIRASLWVRNRERENARFDLDASVSLLYGQYADAFLAPVELDIRKLSLSLYLGPVDLTLGRKIVNWGSGLVFSPADAYSSVDLTDISLRRTGSDLVMAEAYINDLTGAALILSPTSDMTGYKAGAKLFTNLLDFDASLVGVYMDSDADLLLGIALKGTVPIIDIGLTMEGVRHIRDWGDDGWFEAMAGLDYSFFDRTLIVTAEYYFNGCPEELLSIDRIYRGTHYGFVSARVGFLDTYSLSASALANLGTLDVISALQLSAGIFDNTLVSTSLRILSGDITSIPGAAGLSLNYGINLEVRF